MTNVRLFRVFVSCMLMISSRHCVKFEDEDMLQEASDFLLSGANLNVQPCENFFNFACGSWSEKANKTINGTSGNEEYELWATKTNIMLLESLEASRKKVEKMKPGDVPNYIKWTLTFYDQCLDKNKSSELTNKQTLSQLYDYVGKSLGYPDILTKSKSVQKLDKSIWKVQADVQKNFGYGLFFETGTGQVRDPCGDAKSVLQFTPATNFTFFQPGTIQQQILNFTQVLGISVNKDDLSALVKKIANLALDLNYLVKTTSAEIEKKLTVGEQGMADDNVKVYDFDGLTNINKYIEWAKFFKYLLDEKQFAKFNYTDVPFLLSSEDYFVGLTKILTKYDYDTVLSFAFWRVVNDNYALLTLDEEEEQPEVKNAVECLELMKKLFASSAVRMIFDHKGWNPTDWRTDLELLFENIRAAFKFFISGSDWLDNEEKMNLIKKANHITFYSGIPRWLNNDTAINQRTSEFDPTKSVLQNTLNVIQKMFSLGLDALVSEDEYEDDIPDFTINAYYGAMRIALQLGHMLPPAYHPDYPIPLKYGLLGWVLGHEFFHAFDENQIDELPPKVSYLLKEDHLRQYSRKKSCLQKQISSFCFKKKGKCISGKQTLAETMADVDGLKVAFMAYKFASLTQSEDPPIPGLINMSPDQIFFLMAGRYRCASNLNLAIYLDREEEHAPSQSRIHIPIRNFRDFARAYQCPVGSPEAPAKTCNIWGNYYGETPFAPVVKRR